ncbi:MAG: cobalamin-binding protein [Candidatus Krumholzibacteria bacterium]|nr:cobalamin-binding protein [Candidatus Krumholzibacteria bacterium]
MTKTDNLGLLRPAVDAHTLGLDSVAQLVRECGFRAVAADAAVCEAAGRPLDESSGRVLEDWLARNGITVLGLSYRLSPGDGAAMVEALVAFLKRRHLLGESGGGIRGIFFAGLPETCRLVRARSPEITAVFQGDETPPETLRILGIDPAALPRAASEGIAYDQSLLAFGRRIVGDGGYLGERPRDRGGYPGYGTRSDTVIARVRHSVGKGLGPLYRAPVGPYLPDRGEAVNLFLQWARELAAAGFLDILSIGTSQLTQSEFGRDWDGLPNGGGVPLGTPAEFAAAWDCPRPMLVRAYAGTRDVHGLARMYEETISIAWHALSLWWFCLTDGRGPNSVRENLRQHLETMAFAASTGKPVEPNVPHHFAFRGADDATCVVSAVLAARAAKAAGVRWLILQIMLNTPRSTWGIQDLAKSRAMLRLVRELEDRRFGVILQPRGGLDFFSTDLDRARAQLAAVTALMDDIEPRNPSSPPIVHVVGYSEASHLADPRVINESIRITSRALAEYRRLRAAGQVADMSDHAETEARTAELLAEARTVLAAVESSIPRPYSAEGLYRIFREGFLPVPRLYGCREEFPGAVQWETRTIRGSVKVVDAAGLPVSAAERMSRMAGGR